MSELYHEDELQHHGVKGMKWGVRRYQNPDGSLTAAGIKKYGRAGYAQDAYNSNRTKVGKVYDRVTDAHKHAGDIMYARSSDKARKARAEKYVKDTNAAKAQAKAKIAAKKKSKSGKISPETKKKATQYATTLAATLGTRVATNAVLKNNTNMDAGSRFVASTLTSSLAGISVNKLFDEI